MAEDQANAAESEIKDIGEALQDVPFEELLKIKSQGFTKRKKPPASKDHGVKKAKKGEPIERSAKIPVKSFDSIPEKKKLVRDPRFDRMSGKFNEDLFKKSYSFVNEYRKAEIQETEAKLKKIQKIKGKGQVEPMLKSELQSLKAAVKKNTLEQLKGEVKSNIKQANKERVMENKTPYFYKKKEIDNMVLAKKLDAIGDQKKVENYMSKKRRETEGKRAGMVKGIQAKKLKKMQSLE